jgi:hypothetical protein
MNKWIDRLKMYGHRARQMDGKREDQGTDRQINRLIEGMDDNNNLYDDKQKKL